jgi:exopolysaccharide biosynthesis polyprenyl glycosylphosphotransferase
MNVPNFADREVLVCPARPFGLWSAGAKRAFDVAAALALVLLGAPLLALIALVVRLDSPGPIFFRQQRVGRGGRPFRIWKFRTMVVDAEHQQRRLEGCNEMKDGVLFKIKDDPRVTRVGRLLRRTSLDELPQLFNVIGGEMSLVGPRPLALRDAERLAPRHHARFAVLPGITGLWQVSGRSDIGCFEEVFRLDMAYVRRCSFRLDMHILWRTVGVVLRRQGSY